MSQYSFYNIGFFGGENFGDELLCRSVINRLREVYLKSNIYVMTLDTEISRKNTAAEVEYIKGGWPGVDYYLNLGQHLHAVINSSVTLIGGGGLIADHYDWTCLPRHCIDVLWSILLGRRYVFVGLGVYKVRRWWLRRLAKFVCLNAITVYCRDADSAERIRKLTGREDIKVGPDLANMARGLLSHKSGQKNYALINIREKPAIEEQKVTELCRELLKNVDMLVLFSSERADTTYYNRLMANWDSEMQTATKVIEPQNLDEGIRWIQQARFVAAIRLHVNVVAVHAGKKLLTITYEEKVKQFIDILGDKSLVCSLEEVGADQARRLLASKPPDRSAKLAEFEKQAKEQFDKTIEMGLVPGRYKTGRRFIAAVYLAILLSIGFFWCLAYLMKRKVLVRLFRFVRKNTVADFSQ
jgi:polysaccharide pyruvyl transferase WcaK-like protein